MWIRNLESLYHAWFLWDLPGGGLSVFDIVDVARSLAAENLVSV